jgi:hypothetical protein
MSKIFIPAFVALTGCATLPAVAPQPGDAEIRLALSAAEASLRQLVLDVRDDAAVPDYAGSLARLDVARVTVATQAVLGAATYGAVRTAERALLGVTLKVCADGVEKMAAGGRADAQVYAQGQLGFSCLVPLSLFAVR